MKLLAKSYARAHKTYLRYLEVDGVPSEVGWNYSERPNIGFLAAAAWLRKGWVAIEEYASEKTREGLKGRGRADLYIGAKLPGDHHVSFSLEAKQAFVNSKAKMERELNRNNRRSALCRAINDAGCIGTDHGDYRCGAIFVCPEIPVDEKFDEKLDQISEAFWNCRSMVDNRRPWAAFSFVSPEIKRSWPIEGINKQLSYPAIGVLIVSV